MIHLNAPFTDRRVIIRRVFDRKKAIRAVRSTSSASPTVRMAKVDFSGERWTLLDIGAVLKTEDKWRSWRRGRRSGPKRRSAFAVLNGLFIRGLGSDLSDMVFYGGLIGLIKDVCPMFLLSNEMLNLRNIE